jgi:hypothetical protein
MFRLLCVAALLVPVSATAGETTPPAKTAPAATKSADDGDKKICRRVTTIGSNVPGKKVCITRSEYEETQRAARDEAKQMTSGGGHQSGN